jgi:hypothetical protein
MRMNRNLLRMLMNLLRKLRLVLSPELLLILLMVLILLLLILLLLILLIRTDSLTMTVRKLLPTTVIIHETNPGAIAIAAGIVHLVLGPGLVLSARTGVVHDPGLPVPARLLATVADKEEAAYCERAEDDQEAYDWDGDNHAQIQVRRAGGWGCEGET